MRKYKNAPSDCSDCERWRRQWGLSGDVARLRPRLVPPRTHVLVRIGMARRLQKKGKSHGELGEFLLLNAETTVLELVVYFVQGEQILRL